MRYFFVFLFAAFSALSALAQESPTQEVSVQASSSYTFQPCDYWRYEFDISNWVCAYLGPEIEVVDPESIEDLRHQIANQEIQIRGLERTVLTLRQELEQLKADLGR